MTRHCSAPRYGKSHLRLWGTRRECLLRRRFPGHGTGRVSVEEPGATGDAVLRESLAEGVGNRVWGRLDDGQKCGASPTEGHATGTGRIASSDGCCHARDKGSSIGLMQMVLHGGGEQRILPTVQGMHEQGCATTVKDGVGPFHLGWQDSAFLCGGTLEARYGDNQGKVVGKGQCHIVVLCLHSV